MAQSLVKIYLHVVFSTKNRAPFLGDRGLRGEMHAVLGAQCRKLGAPSLIVGGVEDHIHLLCFLGKTLAPADLVKELKRPSSIWIKERESPLADFHWQLGYGAFSLSPSHVDGLIEYIRNQEEHHKKESFQDEFRRPLKKYGVEYDERYVWD